MSKHRRTGTTGTAKFRPMNTKSTKIINKNRPVEAGQTHLRSKDTIKRLEMYKDRAVRDKDGRLIHGDLMSRIPDAKVKRIAPDRKWFGNTRTVGQEDMSQFREKMSQALNDPYQVVMRNKKLPLGLLNDTKYQKAKPNLLTAESFAQTFGPKSQRKKPRAALGSGGAGLTDMASLVQHVQSSVDQYEESKDPNSNQTNAIRAVARADYKGSMGKLFEKGQSRRLWAELYKVIDSSDVVVQVLDIRDPMGTRCKRIGMYFSLSYLSLLPPASPNRMIPGGRRV